MSAVQNGQNGNVGDSQTPHIAHPQTVVHHSRRITAGRHLARPTGMTTAAAEGSDVFFPSIHIGWVGSRLWPRTDDNVFGSSPFHQHFVRESTSFSKHGHIQFVVEQGMIDDWFAAQIA